MFCVHVYIAKMYIAAYMSLGVHMHTIDELTESNIGIALDEFRSFLDRFRDKFIDKMGTKSWI